LFIITPEGIIITTPISVYLT